MRVHRVAARVALALALVHPLLYTLRRQPRRPWDDTGLLSVSTDSLYLASGALAWALLIVLVAMAVWRKDFPYRYETWRLMHAVCAVLVAGSLAHHAIAGGRYSHDPVLAGFWIALLALAALSIAWVYLLKPLRQRRHPWRVVSTRAIAERTTELEIENPSGQPLSFEAGQFVWLNVGHSPFSVHENPFSISSAPSSAARLQFVIKAVGDMTSALPDVAPGTVAYLDGPHGNLTLGAPAVRVANGLALIAGGVGIAPLLSIIRHLEQSGDQRPVTLVYGNRSAEQIVYPQALAQFAAGTGHRVVQVLREPPPGWQGLTGNLDEALIRQVFEPDAVRGWTFLLCGPPPMVDASTRALRRLGVHRSRILAERFDY
jgi:predicted ferric reductase